MKERQVREYTALARRRSEILLHTGASWKPEYEQELRELNQKIEELRVKIFG